MTVNPQITRDPVTGKCTLTWTRDQSAKAYIVETPTGSALAGGAKTSSNLGVHDAITASVTPLYADPAHTETASYPPAPPPVTSKLGHLQASCYGTLTLPDAQTLAARHSYIAVQGFNHQVTDAVKAIDPSVWRAVYKDAPKIGTQATSGAALNANYAVAQNESLSNWLAGGTWNQGLLANVADPGYAQKWAANAVKAAQAGGFDTVFADDVSYHVRPTADWLAWLKVVYPALKATGLRLVCNVGSSTDNSMVGVIPQWLPYMDGLMEESWSIGGGSTSHNGVFDTQARIDNALKLMAAAKTAGRRVLGEIPADDGQLAQIRYGIALALLGDDGHVTVGVAGSPASDGQHYWKDVWTADMDKALALGAPLDPPVKPGGPYTRAFEHGTVSLTLGTGASF